MEKATVSRSSTEAEYRSMASTTCELIWLCYLLKDLHISVQIPLTLLCGNKAAQQIAANPSYYTLTSYFSQNRDFNSEHKFLKQMIADGNTPTVVTYGTLIHAYCLAGNLDDALNIFEEMLMKSKDPPNTVIYNVLIGSLCKHGKVERALSLMDEMLQKSIRPNTTTYNAMLKGISSTNRLRDAFRLLDQRTHQACNPDYVTIEIINDWLSAVGEFEKLREFVQGYQVSLVASSA